MKTTRTKIFPTLLFVMLTILTQIGGMVYLISLIISKKLKTNFKLFFIGIYLISTFLIVPFIASILGREKVKYAEKI